MYMTGYFCRSVYIIAHTSEVEFIMQNKNKVYCTYKASLLLHIQLMMSIMITLCDVYGWDFSLNADAPTAIL